MGSLFSKPADDEAVANQQQSNPIITNDEQQNSILTKTSNDESKKTSVSSSSDDSSDDESDSSSSSSSSSDDDSDSAAAVSADSGSDSESELMEKMYGFTKKTAHSDFKRPTTTTTDIQQLSQKQNTVNDLKRKREEESKDSTSASSNMMMISKEQVEDWIRNIQLPEHVELIALGQVTSHIMNTVVIRADNEYTTGQRVWDEQQKNKKTGATSADAVLVNPSDDNDIHIGGQYDEEDENDESKVENAESLMRTVAPQVFQPTTTTTVVITPNSDAMNELVNRRMLQKQREKMMSQSAEFKRQEEEWRNTLLLRVGEGTVVFDENRKPVGKIVDIFGPVHQPFYRLAIVQPAPALETVSTEESTAAPVDHVVAETIQQEQSIVEEQQTQMNDNSVDKEQPLESVKEAITTQQQEKLSVDQPMDMQEDEVEQELDIVLESEQAEEEQKSEEQPIPSKEEAVVEPLANLTGNTLYFVIQHSSILNVSNVIDSTIKGSDGTGEKDMELDVEFSDDEDEAKSNKRKRQKVSHNNSTDMQFTNTRGRGRGGSRGSTRGRGGMVRGRGRGRGRGGRYHPYATGDEGHPVDYSDFAKLFNQMVPAPGSPQHETPAYEPVTDYPSYVPCSPPHSPSPAQND